MKTKAKIVTLAKLAKLARDLRRRGKKIVLTNGAFDILHLGHVTYLQKARSFGDFLIIAVNSDRSVRGYKGPDRPVNPERDRMGVLSALECVDYVVLFAEPTPLKVIEALKPHILVKGADYKKSQIAGAREVEAWGGHVKLVPFVKGRSTTRILEKARS